MLAPESKKYSWVASRVSDPNHHLFANKLVAVRACSDCGKLYGCCCGSKLKKTVRRPGLWNAQGRFWPKPEQPACNHKKIGAFARAPPEMAFRAILRLLVYLKRFFFVGRKTRGTWLELTGFIGLFGLLLCRLGLSVGCWPLGSGVFASACIVFGGTVVTATQPRLQGAKCPRP